MGPTGDLEKIVNFISQVRGELRIALAHIPCLLGDSPGPLERLLDLALLGVEPEAAIFKRSSCIYATWQAKKLLTSFFHFITSWRSLSGIGTELS